MTDFFNVWADFLAMLFPSTILTIYDPNDTPLWTFHWGDWVCWLIWIGLMVWILTLSTRLFVRIWRVYK